MPKIQVVQQSVAPTGVTQFTPVPANQGFAQLGKLATHADNILEDLQQREAAIEAGKISADFTTQRDKRQEELRNSVESPQGFTDLASKDFDAASEQLINSQKNERVQALLRNRMPTLKAREVSSSIAWEADARHKIALEGVSETQNKLGTMLLSHPDRYGEALSDFDEMLKASGVPPVEHQAILNNAKNSLSFSSVSGMINGGQARRALKELEGGKWDNELSARGKSALIDGAQAEIRRQEAEARARASQARQEMAYITSLWRQDNAASIAMTLTPVPPPYPIETIKATLGEKEAARIEHEISVAKALGEATIEMPHQSVPEMRQVVEKLKPVPGQEGFAAQRDVHAAANKKMASIINQRNTDPGEAAIVGFKNVRERWNRFTANASDPTKASVYFKDFLRASDAAQASWGIPASNRRLVPDFYAKAWAENVKTARSGDASLLLERMKQDTGEFGPRVLNQYQKHLDPYSKQAATMQNKEAAATLLDVSRSVSTKEGGTSVAGIRRQVGATEGTGSVSYEIADNPEFKRFSAALISSGRRSAIADTFNSAEMLAYGLMGKASISESEAARQAVQHVISDQYALGPSRNGIPLVVPKTRAGPAADPDHAARVLNEFIGRLKPEDLEVPFDATGRLGGSYVNSVKAQSYWATTADEKGVVLMAVDRPVTKKNGRPVYFSWDQINELPSEPKQDIHTRTKVGPIPKGEDADFDIITPIFGTGKK